MNEIIFIVDFKFDIFDFMKDKIICGLIDEKKIAVSVEESIPKEYRIRVTFNDPWDRLTVRTIFDMVDFFTFYD